MPRPPELSRFAAAAALLASAIAIVGCPPALEDPERFLTTCPPDVSAEALLRARCAGENCHGGSTAFAAHLDLVSPGLFGRMLDAPAAECEGSLLIASTKPEDSLLLRKLEGTAFCGARMPLGSTPFGAGEVDCVRAWIHRELEAGTPPDEPIDGGVDTAMDAPDDARAAFDAAAESDAAGQ